MSELKSCPCCPDGGRPIAYKDDFCVEFGMGPFVKCEKCRLRALSVEAWNTRPTEKAPAPDMPNVIKFLLGEGALDGIWYGQGWVRLENGRTQPYWWRTALRKAWESHCTVVPVWAVDKARERLDQIEIEMNAIRHASPKAISEIRFVLDLLPRGEK